MMVTKKEEENLNMCEKCCSHYRDPALAKKCEEWCKTHNTCNLEIIKNAIENRKD